VGMANYNAKKDEDRAFVEGNGEVMGIFDGHCGSSMAQFAVDTFSSELRNVARSVPHVLWEDVGGAGLARLGSAADAQIILTAAFHKCHEAARGNLKKGGTTALVFWSCLVDGNRKGFCANAGDSRAVLR
jgi:serine/threonine protein phosphatase PrpC